MSGTEHDVDPQPKSGRRWRDDPLSVFLAVAAVLLAVMYLLEERQIDELQNATQRAQELGSTSLNLEGCLVQAAGARGRTLVVSCAEAAANVAARAQEERPTLTEFDEIVFVGTDGQLVCSPTGDWSTSCAARANPPRREARRRQ